MQLLLTFPALRSCDAPMKFVVQPARTVVFAIVITCSPQRA